MVGRLCFPAGASDLRVSRLKNNVSHSRAAVISGVGDENEMPKNQPPSFLSLSVLASSDIQPAESHKGRLAFSPCSKLCPYLVKGLAFECVITVCSV